MAKRDQKPRGHRDRLLPMVASAFAELGYRAATTAELARRCGVRENVLYRVWPSKKEMFLAAIDYVSELSLATWRPIAGAGSGRKPAARKVLDYEAVHHGEFGLYRIVFAGLSETDDAQIRERLRGMYLRFHEFIVEQIGREPSPTPLDSDLMGWMLVGLGTISNISRELGLMSETRRQALFRRMGDLLLGSTEA